MCSDHARGDVLSGARGELPKEFLAVAQEHGQDMVETVLDAGLCSEAVAKLVAVGRSTDRSEVLTAVMVLARSFNRVSSKYCKNRGWTEEMLALCDRDLQLAFAGKVWTPEDGKRIVLDA